MKGATTAKGSYTVKAISRLGDETGEYGHVPAYEVRIDKGGKWKSPTARRLRLGRPSTAIIGDMEAIGAVSRPYVSDFADIPYTVNSCRLDRPDAHRIPRQIDDAGPVVFEVTAAYLPSQSI